jgi:hypothetical protein
VFLKDNALQGELIVLIKLKQKQRNGMKTEIRDKLKCNGNLQAPIQE